MGGDEDTDERGDSDEPSEDRMLEAEGTGQWELLIYDGHGCLLTFSTCSQHKSLHLNF